MPKRQEIIIRIAAVLMSIVFAGLILVIFGLNPLKIFATIIKGSLGTEIRIQQTIIRAIPLTITALGIIVAFKMKFWNIGAEGQITMGAFGATWVALNLPETLPMPVMLLLMMIAAMLCGGIWAGVGCVIALATETASAAYLAPLCLCYALMMIGTRFFPDAMMLNPMQWVSGATWFLTIVLAFTLALQALFLKRGAQKYV